MAALTRIARLIAWTGITTFGALHLVWASGSSWPAKNRRKLSEAVVGSAKSFPGSDTAAIIGSAAFTAGAITGGALGEGRFVVGLRGLIGVALLLRAVFGGEAALAALDLPAPGRRFRDLDRRYYRRLSGVLGAAVLIGARRRR